MELKDKLNAFLLDEDAHCLLLDGPWGVGKTYEVDRWRESIKDYKVIKLSLFGISSVEELNSLALNSESLFNRFKSYLKKINQDVNVGVGPVTVSAPIIGIVANLVKPKHSKKEKYLFIIDDVERKDSNLKIADIFGFVDSLSKENTKVVLITNEKKIYDKDLAGFKEKIVQYEHHLTKPSEEAIKTIFGTNKKIPESIEIDNLRTLKYVKRIVNSLKNDISSVLVKTIFLCSLFIKENKYSREDYFVNYERDARSIIPFIDQSKREKELVRIEAKLNELKKENKNGVFYLIENIKLLNLLNEVKENKIHDFVAEVYNYIATDDYSSLNEIQVPLKESTFKKIDEKGAYIFLSDNPNKEYSNIMNTFADIFKTDDYNLLDAFRNMGVAMAVNESLAKHDNFSLAAEKRVLKACVIPVAKYIFYNVSSEEEHVGLEQPFIYNKKEWLETAKDKVFREYCSVLIAILDKWN